jgi:hypothetical protein
MGTTTALAIAVLMVIAVLGALRRRRRAIDPDSAVLQQLQKAGSALTKRHSPEFFLY